MVVLPLVHGGLPAHARYMELLVLLVVLAAVNVALLLGWGVDSRDNQNWDPARRP